MMDEQKLDGLTQAWLDGRISDAESLQLQQLLRESGAARSFFLNCVRLNAVLREVADAASIENGQQEPSDALTARGPIRSESAQAMLMPLAWANSRASATWQRWLRTAACLLVLGCAIAAAVSYRKSLQNGMAVITGLSGALVWTGDGGHVTRSLAEGERLSGGTIEGMAPDAWCELTFRDGSTVVISGQSSLTWADDGQKQLRLKEGRLVAHVRPQPPNRPLQLYTRTAALEVVGTRFSVDAALSSTVLSVSEGMVRATRLSDGQTVEVAANYRVVAGADRDFVAESVPEVIDVWQSQLNRSPEGTYGDWVAPDAQGRALLRAIPYTTEHNLTIYAAGVGVSSGDRPPVILRHDSTVCFRGFLKERHYVFFGVTLRHPNGDFAGRFQTVLPAEDFRSDGEFAACVEVRDLSLDPALRHVKDKLSPVPFDLVVESVWCHTLADPAGLALRDVQIATDNPTLSGSAIPSDSATPSRLREQ